MKIPKQAHTTELKELAVKRIRDGQSVGTVCKDLGLSDQTLRNWVKAAAQGKLIVTDALTMAWFRKRPASGLMHPSDRGSQYFSHTFQDKLKAYGMICSMSRKGNCWDNAPTEIWFNSFPILATCGNRSGGARG